MTTFEFHFDTELSHKLRDAVNDKQNLSIDKTSNAKDIGNYFAWDRICAIMDRIDDTIIHLNSMKLGCNQNRSAFDFYEFVSCSAVLIDCIREIGKIFNIDISLIGEIVNSQEIFGKEYSEAGTDGKFFEYIRSLCVIHPTNTSRQKEYLQGSRFHCCPFVTWNHVLHLRTDGDLTATVYNSKREGPLLQIPLYICQFENYVKKWVLFIEKVIEAINKYSDDVYEKFRNIPVKTLSEFNDDVVAYLKYLKDEYGNRFGDNISYVFDEYIRVFSINLTNEGNKGKIEKYKNAILYSIDFLRNALQNMSFDGFENSGIKYPDASIETDLFLELSHIFNIDSAFKDFSYNLEKIYHLEPNDTYNYYEKQYARRLLEEIKPIVNEFVNFENTEEDEEVIVLIQLAKYLDALKGKNLLNKNIPNEEKYRTALLSKPELKDLFAVPKPKVRKNEYAKTLEEILKMYGQ